ncbi:MAG: helix-turn-helix domain-containing protein [Desulfatiglandales bacterium]
MKRLTEQNYYTLLGISPEATFEEVRSAYDQAMSIYSADSIATYSLLTREERERMLSRLVDAYKTLTNSQLRKEYNSFLVEKGELSPQEIGLSSLKDSDTAKGKLKDVSVESLVQREERTENENQPSGDNLDLPDNLTSVTGRDIKMLRIAGDISLEEIYRKTNIPKKTVEDIEEENFENLPALVYLKGFLKTYAKVLNINEDQMVDGYIERFLEWKNIYQR